MKTHLIQKRASLDEELNATVFVSFFLRVGPYIGLSNHYYVALSYANSSRLILGDCCVTLLIFYIK